MNDRRIRGIYIQVGMALVILIYLVRLFYLQVLSEEYSLMSRVQDLDDVELLPARGIIFDRNDKIYVKNSPLYDIMFIPKRVTIPDTSILTEYLELSAEEIRTEIKKHDPIARLQWQPLATQVDMETYNRFSEQMWQFDGLSVQARPMREYNYPCGAHFLGFINEVNPQDLKRAKEDGDTLEFRYRKQDLIGRTGVERRYEKRLRGSKGKKTILVDAFNREVGSYAGGKYDEFPLPGEDLKLGIDVELQMLGEKLMLNKRGSIVAIEPKSGEILAFVSAPSFAPGLLTGSKSGKNHLLLQQDTLLKPLINRPLSAQYPPGSIFKILQSLAGLAEGVIQENTHFACPGFWRRGPGNKPRCHGAHGSCSLLNAIKYSCNPFFAEAYYTFMSHPKFGGDIVKAYDRWHEIMSAFGIGRKLGVDIPNEKTGNLPPSSFYDRIYKGSWSGVTIYSNGIGRGEITLTPLQMANVAATIANRGWYIKPHFLRSEKDTNGVWQRVPYEKITVPGKPEHYDVVIQAMQEVVEGGTARRAHIDSIVVCGKTGTVENKKDGDHSVFMAFAPRENPKIAIAVVVENAGFGGTWAAPISSLMIEKFLTGKISDERKLQRILEARILPPAADSLVNPLLVRKEL